MYTGARAPSTRPDKNVSFIWRLVPYRDILESPPFFFKEVRLALLTFSLLYGICRVINEAVRSDVFVVLATVRLCATAYMLGDQWWLCRNWKPFFVEHNLRAWLWLRAFVVISVQSLVISIDVMNDSEWTYFALHIVAGLVVSSCYLWGKRWDWRRNDLDDDRRIRAGAYASTGVGVVFFARTVYDFLIQNGYVNSSLVIAIGYLLIGMVLYAIDRRQRRLKATISQRQSTLNSLIMSGKNNRVASGGDDGNGSDSSGSGDEKRDDVHDAENVEEDELAMTVSPFVFTDNPASAVADDLSTLADVPAGGGNGNTGTREDHDDPVSTPAPALASTAEDSKRDSSRRASVFDPLRRMSSLHHHVARRVSLHHHTIKHKVDTVVSDRIVAVMYQVHRVALLDVSTFAPSHHPLPSPFLSGRVLLYRVVCGGIHPPTRVL